MDKVPKFPWKLLEFLFGIYFGKHSLYLLFFLCWEGEARVLSQNPLEWVMENFARQRGGDQRRDVIEITGKDAL